MRPHRLRLITNLDCNFNCSFCYQKKKDKLRLSPENVKNRLTVFGGHFTRASVMGGEAVLYPDDLVEHIRVAKQFSDIVGLTTNGSLLTVDLMKRLKEAGLRELGVSVPSFLHFHEITKHDIDAVLKNLEDSKKFFKSVRVNITQNIYNIDDEIYTMIKWCLNHEYGVVICEDITRDFTMKFKEKLNAELVHDDKRGFLTYELPNGQAFSMFHKQENYNDTDLIVTPLGDFYLWTEYCKAVGTKKINECGTR